MKIFLFSQAELADSTGVIWVSFFREQAQELMNNVTAEQFAQAKANVKSKLLNFTLFSKIYIS